MMNRFIIFAIAVGYLSGCVIAGKASVRTKLIKPGIREGILKAAENLVRQEALQKIPQHDQNQQESEEAETKDIKNINKNKAHAELPPAKYSPEWLHGSSVPTWQDMMEDMITHAHLFPQYHMSEKQVAWWHRLSGRMTSPAHVGSETKMEDVGYVGPQLCTRKEYRQMTSDERTRYHNAVVTMAQTRPDPDLVETEYDLFVFNHQVLSAPAAHFGPAFLPWHREFLFRFESALQSHDPSICVPYWDSRLENHLPEPAHSLMWTPAHFGGVEGDVTTGPYANWTAIPDCRFDGDILVRHALPGADGRALLVTEDELEWFKKQRYFADISCLNISGSCFFEHEVHGSVHLYFFEPNVSLSHISYVPCAVTDPIFWLHHSYLDNLWEELRHNYQVTDPYTEYPDVGDTLFDQSHAWYNPMRPFDPYINGHGISSHYTTLYYTFTTRPSSLTCSQPSDCGDPGMVWCHDGACAAKVTTGGICGELGDAVCAGDGCAADQTPYCDSEGGVLEAAQCACR